MSQVGQAIAAAEAVLPELRRLDTERDVLWKALPTSAQRIAARDQARLITPHPDVLVFPPPSRTLARMELHYADGSIQITDDFDPAFRLATREQLEAHCRQAGLEAEPLLAIWDDWRARLSEAEAEALFRSCGGVCFWRIGAPLRARRAGCFAPKRHSVQRDRSFKFGSLPLLSRAVRRSP